MAEGKPAKEQSMKSRYLIDPELVPPIRGVSLF